MVQRILYFRLTIVLFINLLIASCSKVEKEPIPDMSNISISDIDFLNSKKIFFGHKSVGNNILSGLNSIYDTIGKSQFQVYEIDSVTNITSGVIHSYIGINGNPKSKVDDFKRLILNRIKDSVDLALMKFCYVDFDANTDIEGLLEYYDNAIAVIRKEFPKMIIIHSTAPLTTHSQNKIKSVVKRILKRDNNIYINKYNGLLRKRYKKELIFDIAAFESTFENGKSNIYLKGYEALIDDYTYDGGHLNSIGQNYVARKFIMLINSLNN